MIGIDWGFRNDGYRLTIIPNFNNKDKKDYKPFYLSIGSKESNKSVRLSVDDAKKLIKNLKEMIKEIEG